MGSSSIASLLLLAGQSPWLQAAAIVLGTFILEDAATVAAGMAAQAGTVPVPLAIGALFVGIVLGDLGLYGAGRAAALIPWVRRWLPRQRQAAVRAWLDGRVFKIVLVSRFLPGVRLPTYTTCGFLGANLRQFTLAAVIATCVWTSGLFALSLQIGQLLMDHLGAWRWAGAAGFVIFIIAAGRAAAAGMQGARR
jgi:membrane protein DedA with SNARE-associated domain